MNHIEHDQNSIFTKRRQWAWRIFQIFVWGSVSYLAYANNDQKGAGPAIVVIGGLASYYGSGILSWILQSILQFFGYIPKQPKEPPVGQLDAFARQVGLLDKSGRVLTSKERRRPSEQNRQQ